MKYSKFKNMTYIIFLIVVNWRRTRRKEKKSPCTKGLGIFQSLVSLLHFSKESTIKKKQTKWEKLSKHFRVCPYHILL